MNFKQSILLIFTAILIYCCSDKHIINSVNVRSIKVTIQDSLDNHRNSKTKIFYSKDSIITITEALNSRVPEQWKFLTRYTIEINYSNDTVIYYGNSNHIMDKDRKIYKFNYEKLSAFIK